MVLERIEAPCPRHPEGVHGWQVFAGGVGCSYCEAWKPRKLTTLIDPHPTTAILRPVPLGDTYGEDVELSTEVMNDLLEVARPDVSFRELEAMANRIIQRVQTT